MKFKSLNTAGKNEKLGRHDGENSTRKVNDFSYRRNSDHGKKKEDVGRSFRCREFDSECSDIDEDEELTLEKLKMLRKEDSEARAIKKERIQDLLDENERLMGVISSLKVKLKEVQNVYDQTIKSMKMLTSGTDSLDSILNSGQNGSSKYGLGFDTSTRGVKITPEVKFVPVSVKETIDPSCKKLSTDTGAKFSRWVCYYCGKRGHTRLTKRNNNIRETHMIWRVKTSEKCNVAFTTVQTHVDAWYFDSGCSRHMTGNRSFFTDLEECASGHVTFRDGVKGKIIAKGNIDKIDREYHQKWDVKSDQGIFLGNSQYSRTYKVFNIKSGTVMETINVVVNDFESNVNQFNIEDDETHVTPDVTSTPLDEMPKGDSQPDSAKTNSNIADEVINNETVLVPSAHVKKNHPSSSIIGDSSAGITTRRKEKVDYTKMIADLCYVPTIEPTPVENALKDEYWINVMQEELLQFKRNNVCTLVPKPDGANIIETKLEAIRLLLSISCFRKFKLFQMDVKSAFLNGYLNEEVYVAQPKRFIDSEFPQGETDKTLLINRTSTDLIVAQIYVDDIIFGGFPKTLIKQRSEGMFMSQEKYAKNLVKKFGLDQSQYKRTPAATHAKITKDTVGTAVDHKLYRSMIGSHLYLKASRPDIAYAVEICARYQSDPCTSHLNAVKRIIKYVHGTTDFGILYSYDTFSKLVGYCDADWAGSADDRKSTSGGCFFLGNNLVSWFSKKQNCVSLSTTEVEYITAGSRLHDVPLARLVKKVTAPDVVPQKFVDHVLSDHSQESSSSEGVFSPISDIAAPSDSHAAPHAASNVPEGGTEARSEETPLDNVDGVEPVAPGDHNDEVPVADTVDPKCSTRNSINS
ncbi:putative mitochondrial protein [Cucumis melo var. makuwa]|uniref:Putative mitochondrial protein n=1 Tax=Cucumis melo var. makuwa TaxID=1194695 RepID=A0A5D3DWA8_CUCMM|nr:putative mitochondrial protein [Cucumis melo var. makuwa]